MTKLLNKPLKAFALYALIILGISIPVYVLVVDYIWISELDENNWLTLEHTKQRLQAKEFTENEIEHINQIWGTLQPGVSIVKSDSNTIFQDRFYEVVRPNIYDKDDGEDRFRGLKTFVEINGKPYILTIETNVEESDETFTAVAIVTFLFFMILIFGFIFLNKRISTQTWKPFYQTLHALQSFELSKDNAINLPSSDIKEFDELNQSLLRLVKNNVDTYQQQKSFTENASHELQTPIALLKSKMDLLIQEKDISPEISEILNSIEAPLSRLTRINKNLVLLAKVENRQYSENQQLDVKEFLESTISLFEDYLGEKQLQLTNLVHKALPIRANSFLLETLIHNLLSNAIRHTPFGGQITISCRDNALRVINTGKKSLDRNHLFERFSANSKDKVSSGLGLAIIQEISTKYEWKTSYSFENGFHFFTVEF